MARSRELDLWIYRRYVLSGKRHSRQQQGARGQWWLRESPDLSVLSPSEVLIGVGFAYMFIGVSVRACCVVLCNS
jgi:hypothetical protein